MAQPALTAEGGNAAKITAKLPRDMDARMRHVIRQHDLTLSQFIRRAAEAELERLTATGPPGTAAA